MTTHPVLWRNLYDPDGRVHKAVGPWLPKCAPETVRPSRRKLFLKPTNKAVTCRDCTTTERPENVR